MTYRSKGDPMTTTTHIFAVTIPDDTNDRIKDKMRADGIDEISVLDLIEGGITMKLNELDETIELKYVGVV